jgi:hypothetical protein
LTGKFNLVGAAQVVTTRKGQNPLTTTLQLDVADHSVSGTVTDGSFVAGLTANQAVFSSTRQATNYEGQYTFIMPGVGEPAVGPFGASYGTVTVASTGTIAFVGSLADGSSVSQNSVVSGAGFWPFYLAPYGTNGSLWGWNLFTNHTVVSVPFISWLNATNSSKSAVYRSGFTNEQAAIIGSLYNPAGKPLLSLTNGQVILEEAGWLDSITNQITLASNNIIKLTTAADNTNKLTLTITAAGAKTGLITGSFQNPANPTNTITISGVLLQNQSSAAGYFLGPTNSGSFLLTPP